MAEDGTAVAYALPGERVAVLRAGSARASSSSVEHALAGSGRAVLPVFRHLRRLRRPAPRPRALRRLEARPSSSRRCPRPGSTVAPGAAGRRPRGGRRRLTLHVRAVDGPGAGRPDGGAQPRPRRHRPLPDHRAGAAPGAPAVAAALSAPLGHGRKPLDVAVDRHRGRPRRRHPRARPRQPRACAPSLVRLAERPRPRPPLAARRGAGGAPGARRSPPRACGLGAAAPAASSRPRRPARPP